MTHVITFAHYKGGTGKTTSCISIAGWLAKAGKTVLIVDLDPQGNATSLHRRKTVIEFILNSYLDFLRR
jgi:cellulose biosynthesis protein BcsQ